MNSYFPTPLPPQRMYVTSSVISVLQTSSYPNHTFNRTFNGAAKLLDPTISTPAHVQYATNDDVTTEEIPHALQSEIFQLENSYKFRIHLDPERGNNKIDLICHCQDKHLPFVPPLYVKIPPNYPFQSPMCSLRSEDYLGTEFLKNIYLNLSVRVERLPRLFSLTRLMDAWETSVRQTFSPHRAVVADLSEMFGV